MAITQNPANVYVVGLGAAAITYFNGASSVVDTLNSFAVTAGSVEPFADQEKVPVNGDIKTYLTKNQGNRHNLTAYITYRSDAAKLATTMTPPAIGSRIDFDFYASGTDLNGIVTASKIDTLDGVAVLSVTIETVSGLTFT